MKAISAILLFFISIKLVAIEVPSQMELGGLQLKLTDGVQRMLKADLELITKSPKGFQTKVDRANLYFPLIERVFKEEGLPDDFKFLALQESSLVPDAVSSSNAVGYWQFKKETAQEVGLRVDHVVDERMHIIFSSRGAAKYLKKNNVTVNNWIYALLSYNMGLGGVKSQVESQYVGASTMTIDKNMHWYVIRFLAHKLAYENAVGKEFNPALLLLNYDNCNNKSLRDISNETEVDVLNLQIYNKWLLDQKIPDDKQYFVVLPVTPLHKQKLTERNLLGPKTEEPVFVMEDHSREKKKERKERKEKDVHFKGTLDIALVTSVNRIKAIKAKEGDTPAKLAIQGGIATDDFLRYNDMKKYEAVVPGKVYFLQPKRKKANVLYHTVAEGESIREISQLYGIKMNAIRKKNRMDKNEALQPGRVLFLRSKRSEDTPIEFNKEEQEAKPLVEKINTIVNYSTQKNDETVSSSEKAQDKSTGSSEEGVAYHEVQSKETLYGISKIYSVSVDSIKSWNGLNSNDLSLGMKLIVKKDISAKTIQHTVQQGETMYQISKKYNVKVEDILKWNNKSDSSVAIGESLAIETQE